MKIKFKRIKLYLKYGFGFGFFLAFIAGIQTNFDESSNSIIKNLAFSTSLFLSIGVVISLLLYWYIEIFSPNHSMKILHKENLIQFIDLGFENKGDCLENDLDNKRCRIWWEAISLTNPKKNSINLFMPCVISENKAYQISEKYKDNTLVYYDKGILGTVNYSFRTPKFKILKEKYDLLLSIISENDLKIIKLDRFE